MREFPHTVYRATDTIASNTTGFLTLLVRHEDEWETADAQGYHWTAREAELAAAKPKKRRKGED